MNISKIENAMEFAEKQIPEHYEVIRDVLSEKINVLKGQELDNSFKEYRKKIAELKQLESLYNRNEDNSTKITSTLKENVSFTGINSDKIVDSIANMDEIVQKVEVLKKEIAEELKSIEEKIDSIYDAELRVIIRYKFIEGLNWMQIATKLRYDCSESYPRMRYNRFIGRYK